MAGLAFIMAKVLEEGNSPKESMGAIRHKNLAQETNLRLGLYSPSLKTHSNV